MASRPKRGGRGGESVKRKTLRTRCLRGEIELIIWGSSGFCVANTALVHGRFRPTTKNAKDTKDLGFYYFLPLFLVLKLLFFVIFVNFVVKGSFLFWLRLCRAGFSVVNTSPQKTQNSL